MRRNAGACAGAKRVERVGITASCEEVVVPETADAPANVIDTGRRADDEIDRDTDDATGRSCIGTSTVDNLK